MTHASGPFEVELTSQGDDDTAEGTALRRMSLEKRFHGDLEATSKGEMLSATTAMEGSAGYVAIERVTGRLHGSTGTFALQHSGTVDRGVQALSITVVPDSGSGSSRASRGRWRSRSTKRGGILTSSNTRSPERTTR